MLPCLDLLSIWTDIQKALETKVVQDHLERLGFTPSEIEERLLHASDAELHQLAVHSEVLMAGGGMGIILIMMLILIPIGFVHRMMNNGANSPVEVN